MAPDERSAKVIADRLDRLFNTTDSTSVDLLMARASVALEAKQYDLALKILGQAIDIDPDDIGALSKRATIYYMRDDYGPALADIREVLAREPRHFPMLYGLALILRDIGDDKRALEATRKALEVNPRFEGAKELEGQLVLTVEGREI
ncbi:tetratricopeptide repeat protein [Xanthobacter sediminis]|uniref:tetratricopeptide repeat protein n=1 Tax=Xanthobacter sediminis TaxID=3119926 RepID=UPI00372A8C13